MVRSGVFVSYSRKDKAEKDQLLSHLGVLQRANLIELWSDDQIGAGADWKAEISQAIARAKVAVLLISASFLTSDFILGQEIPPLLKRREHEGLIIFPVIAKACAWRTVDWLTKMNVRPKEGRPVWSDAGSHADEDLATIAEEIATIVKAESGVTPNRLPASTDTAPESPQSPVSTRPVSEAQPVSPELAETNLSNSVPRRDLLQLQEALNRHTLAFFIGADLSRDVTGLASRAELARDLARHYGLDAALSLAEVAQRLNQAGNRWEFTDFLLRKLDSFGKSPQTFHHQVATLVNVHHLKTVITTAYDNLLELAFREAGVGFVRALRSNDLSFIDPNRLTLIKLYGDISQPDSLVVTDRDHTNLLRNPDRTELIAEVKRIFRHNTVLFLGYNLADPDFRFLFDEVAESHFARTAYAFWPGLPEIDRVMWRNRGIVILEADPLTALSASV